MGYSVLDAVVVGSACASLLFAVRPAAGAEVFARVVVAETDLRAGPGVSHRVIHRARRGEVFLVEGRETKGFWLQVSLPDGRFAYALGDTVEASALRAGAENAAGTGKVFAPPALQHARAGFALMAGVYGRSGYAEFRPAWILAPAIALEPYVGVALESDSRRIVYGGAGTLNVAPDWPVAPFLHIGVGGVLESPKDEFIREERRWFHARAGGGLLVSFKLRMLVRLEISNFAVFSEDSYENTQAFVGGLGTYF